jgi:hypothetical protein
VTQRKLFRLLQNRCATHTSEEDASHLPLGAVTGSPKLCTPGIYGVEVAAHTVPAPAAATN